MAPGSCAGRRTHLPPLTGSAGDAMIRLGGTRSVVSAAFLLAGVSCTVLLDHGTEQCQTDDDCARFGNRPTCTADHVCASSGLAPKMCFFGTPKLPGDFLNQCSRGWLLADPTASNEVGEC